MHKRIKNGGIVKKIIKIFIFFQNISGLLVGRGGKKEASLLFKFELVKLDYCKFCINQINTENVSETTTTTTSTTVKATINDIKV